MTVAEGVAGWEQAMEAHGREVRVHYEAQLSAYEMALDVATSATPISEAWIRQLHHRVTAGQSTYQVLTTVGWQDQPLLAGRYKTQPNHVWLGDRFFAYAPVAARSETCSGQSLRAFGCSDRTGPVAP